MKAVTDKEGGAERTFSGYVRDNGDVGIRNEIWIINTVGCINKTCETLAQLAGRKKNWIDYNTGQLIEGKPMHALTDELWSKLSGMLPARNKRKTSATGSVKLSSSRMALSCEASRLQAFAGKPCE